MLIAERFMSIQGEGFWIGMPSYFVRLYGCDVGCPFCDTKETNASKDYETLPVNEVGDIVLEETNKMRLPFMTITGGEPLMQVQELLELVIYLKARKAGLQLQMETSGICDDYEGLKDFTSRTGILSNIWITLSPKMHKQPNEIIFKRCNELKLLVGSDKKSRDYAFDMAAVASPLTKLRFQPLMAKNMDFAKSVEQCFDLAKDFGGRVSLQTHKWINWR